MSCKDTRPIDRSGYIALREALRVPLSSAFPRRPASPSLLPWLSLAVRIRDGALDDLLARTVRGCNVSDVRIL